jgi:hypothetical protein
LGIGIRETRPDSLRQADCRICESATWCFRVLCSSSRFSTIPIIPRSASCCFLPTSPPMWTQGAPLPIPTKSLPAWDLSRSRWACRNIIPCNVTERTSPSPPGPFPPLSSGERGRNRTWRGLPGECHLVFAGTGIQRKLWGRFLTCGGLGTRPETPVHRPTAPVDRGTLWVARRIPSCPA